MTVYVVVENQQITEIHYSLPLIWRNVSGFNLIGDDPETLKSYGWYIVDVVTPEYDTETQVLGPIGDPVYDSENDTVTATYIINDIPKEDATELQRRFLILVRDTRNYLISQSDWTMLADIVKIKSPEWVTAWENYRQNLRDYPDQFSFGPDDLPPNFDGLVWPAKPEN